MKWENFKLKQIADYWTGKIDSSVLDETNYVSTDNLIPDKAGIVNSNYVPKSGRANSFSENDVLISNIRPYFRKIWFANKEGGCSNDVLVFRAKENVEPLYLYYQLSKDTFFDYMVAGSNGTKMPRGNKTSIMEYQLQIPPLPTQRRIASILSAYDDLIENNLKRIRLLEEKAQLHYKEYKPVEKITLQAISDYLGRGVTPKYEEGSGFYAINQKANKGSLLEYSQFKSLDSKFEVPEDKFAKWGDLLINSLGEGTLGRVHFYTDKSDLFAVDQHMSIFRTVRQYYTFYLYQFLISNYGQGLLDSLKKGGTNMTMLNISDLRQLEVLFPIEKDLIELWDICKPLFQLKQTLITQNTLLRSARDILLPRLMNGQIEV